MNKKLIIIIIGVILFIVLLIVYFIVVGNRGPSAPTELTWVTYSEDEKNFQGIISSFEERYNAKIKFVKKDLANYEVDSLNSVATGKIDLWGIPNNWLPKQKGKLAVYNSESGKTAQDKATSYKAIYPGVVISDNIIDDKIYGFPLSVDALVLFYNSAAKSQSQRGRELTNAQEDILDADPTNWDELAAQAQLITQKNGPIVTLSGLAMGTADLVVAPDILTLMMLQNGTQMTSDDQAQATFHTAINRFNGPAYPASRALTLYTSFANPKSPNYSFSTNLGDPIRAFAEGKIAYYVDYSAKAKDVERINRDLNFSMEPIPQVKETQNPVDFISYETFVVPQTSKNQALAWSLVNFLTNEKNMEKYLEVSAKHPAQSDFAQNMSGDVEKAMLTAASWYNPDAAVVETIWRTAITDVLAGQSAQTALDGAAQKVTSLLNNLKE